MRENGLLDLAEAVQRLTSTVEILAGAFHARINELEIRCQELEKLALLLSEEADEDDEIEEVVIVSHLH